MKKQTKEIVRLSKKVSRAYNQYIIHDVEDKYSSFAEFLYCRFNSLHDANKHFGVNYDNFINFNK